MKWVEALKEYAKQKGKYVVPRKGTPEYDEVKKLMGMAHKDNVKADVEKGQEKRDEKKAVAESAPEQKPKKPRAPRKKKSVEEKSAQSKALGDAVMVGPEPRRVAVSKRGKKVEAEKAMVQKSEGKTMLAADKSKNPEAIFMSETNTHEPIAPPAALGGNLAELKKDVAKVRKPRALPVLIEKERVENAAPFSFIDFKRKIGA
jgi:hypothetical protein